MLRDLPEALSQPPASTRVARPAIAGAYVRMATDAAAARRFTRMLYEVHRPLARELAAFLDVETARRLMDLGGGSGIVAMELARRHPALHTTVVDLATVCVAGRELVAEEGLADRVAFHGADFLHDALPGGFDVVLECDVNVYSPELVAKVRGALAADGRYLVVDHLASSAGETVPSRVRWALARSLVEPNYIPPSVAAVRTLLETGGFRIASERSFEVVPSTGTRLIRDLTVLDARLS